MDSSGTQTRVPGPSLTFAPLHRIFCDRSSFLRSVTSMQSRVHIIVEGLVQGVGFRWFVARRAQALGLRGYVNNMYDGNVEIEAEGDRSLLEELIGQVKIGPRSAHVTDIHLEWKELQPGNSPGHYIGFEIR